MKLVGTVLLNEATTNITTSVSTVSMAPFLHSFCTASAASISKRVSASSCEHGERRAQYDSAGEQRTPLPSVAYSSLLSAKGGRTTSSERNANMKLSTDAWFKHFVSNLGTLLMFHDLAFEPHMLHRQFLRQQHEHYWFRADLNPCNEVQLSDIIPIRIQKFTLRFKEKMGLNGCHWKRNYLCLHLVFDRRCTSSKRNHSHCSLMQAVSSELT